TEAAAAKEVRIFDLSRELVDRRRRLFAETERERLRLVARTTLIMSAAWTIFAAGYLGAVGLAVHLAMTGRASVGTVVLVVAIGHQLNQQLAELTGNISWVVHTYRAIQRLRWLMDHA